MALKFKRKNKRQNLSFTRLQREKDKIDIIGETIRYSKTDYFKCKVCSCFIKVEDGVDILKVSRYHKRECQKTHDYSKFHICIKVDDELKENNSINNNIDVIDNNVKEDAGFVWGNFHEDDDIWEDANFTDDEMGRMLSDGDNNVNDDTAIIEMGEVQLTPSDCVINYQEKIEKMFFNHENKDPFVVYKSLLWEDLVDLSRLGELLLIKDGKLSNIFACLLPNLIRVLILYQFTK
jgi:hypothetical protein